jgi:aldose 1-epimerase
VKVQSSTIENKYLRVKSINIGACLYEVYDKQKKINLILNLEFDILPAYRPQVAPT